MRLVQAGVKFVTVRAPGSGPGSKAHDWDDHAVNWDMHTAMLARLPKYDQVVSTLINDLYDRGLDKRVLLIVTGEFGRTPRLEHRDGRIGRDHYPAAMSILMAGGGIKGGTTAGATDEIGSKAVEDVFHVRHMHATILTQLGLSPEKLTYFFGGLNNSLVGVEGAQPMWKIMT